MDERLRACDGREAELAKAFDELASAQQARGYHSDVEFIAMMIDFRVVSFPI